MRRAPSRAWLLVVLLGCEPEEAPRCHTDDDCGPARRCVPEAGVCVRMTQPLLDAGPDAGPLDAPTD
jgi:hypothetical protein